MSPDRIQRALAEATREARSEALPAIDWEGVEERLPMTRIATIPPRPVSYRPYAFAAAFAFAAGALALGLGIGGQQRAATPAKVAKVGTPTAPKAPNVTGELDGNTLESGARVSAGEQPQSVVHAGHVTWTLAPHSTAVVLTRGEVVAIRLEAGSVTSRVVKSSRVETFAVEAADVRVAAHGTEFVVTLGADGVSVSVTEGTVLVGPRDQPGVGEFLAGPAAKRFTLGGRPFEDAASAGLAALRPHRPGTGPSTPTTDPAPSNDTTPAPAAPLATDALHAMPGSGKVATSAGPKAKNAKPEAAVNPAASAAEPRLAPEKPSPTALESVTHDVVKLAAACFKQRTATSDGVRIMAQTTVTFRTTPEGAMKSVDFDPPLSPWVQVCVNAGMGGLKTEATRYGFQGSRTVDLER